MFIGFTGFYRVCRVCGVPGFVGFVGLLGFIGFMGFRFFRGAICSQAVAQARDLRSRSLYPPWATTCACRPTDPKPLNTKP